METNTTSKNNVISSEATKVSSNQTSIPGTSSGQGMQIDTTKKTKARAIIHKAPEQEKIDSIKNAKQKNKFK